MAAILISKWWTTDHEEKDATYIFMTLRQFLQYQKSKSLEVDVHTGGNPAPRV